MSEYVIEMYWTCRYCNTEKLRGLTKHCRVCGHAKDAEDQEFFPEDVSVANAIQEAHALREADAGPNWRCKFCSSLESALNACCTECGCSMADGGQPWRSMSKTIDPTTGVVTEGEEVFEARAPVATTACDDAPSPAVDVQAPPQVPVDAEEVEARRRTYRSPPAHTRAVREEDTGWPPRVREVAHRPWQPTDDDVRAFKAKSPLPWIVAIGAVVMAFLLWLLLHTRVVDASVTSVSWTHTVKVDRYRKVAHEGWTVPSDAVESHDLGSREHHKDRVRVGSHKEHHDEECRCHTVPGECKVVPGDCHSVKGKCHKEQGPCKRLGNGAARCSEVDVCDKDMEVCGDPRRRCADDRRVCDTCRVEEDVDDFDYVPRYQEWHGWLAWEWTEDFREVIRTGSSTTTTWPSDAELTVPLGPGESERSHRVGSYRVTLTDADRDVHVVTPRSESDLQRYPVGTPFKLRVNAAGSVEVVSR